MLLNNNLRKIEKMELIDMDIEEEQIEWGRNLVRQFMVKDRKNLRYLNLIVAIIGFFTYLWAINDLEGIINNFTIFIFIFITFGSLILYFIWYWTEGDGGKYLDIIDAQKNVGIATPKSYKYWNNMQSKYIQAMSDWRWNDLLEICDHIIMHRTELEISNASYMMLLSAAESSRALSFFHLGQYENAIIAYNKLIKEDKAKGLDTNLHEDILNQCLEKNQKSPQIQQQKSQILPTPNLMKNCPFCQTSNLPSNNQCELCLSQI